MRPGVLALAALVPLLSACGGGAPTGLRATAFQPPAGATSSGERSRDGNGGAQARRRPSFAVRPAPGAEVTYGVTLVNRGDAAVRVRGVVADEDVDGLLRSTGLQPAEVRLAPGARAAVTVVARADGCDAAGGTQRVKQDQLLAVTEDGEDREVRVQLPAIMEVACA